MAPRKLKGSRAGSQAVVITDLPTETLDHIASAIDSPTDIRNLAAVCTQLRSLLSPNHTQFRVIRAPLDSPIWKKIAENRLLAQNIRVVEIGTAGDLAYYRHDGEVKFGKLAIPTIFQELEVPSSPALSHYWDDADGKKAAIARWLDAERILVSALKRMSGLTSFRWACEAPLINCNQEDDIWITLAKYCTSLNVIDVLDHNSWTDDPIYQRPSLNPNFYLIKELKSFSLNTCRSDGFNVFPAAEKRAEMLIRKCPDLEVLKLGYDTHIPITYVPASPLISGPSWTFLRELVLRCFHFISTELAPFLASHPTVEILSLKSTAIDQFLKLPPGVIVLPPGALPRLKRLSADPGSALANSILDSTVSTPRRLESIDGSLLDDAFLDSLEHSGSGLDLEKLITVYNGGLNHLLPKLSDIAPKLQWLDISQYPSLPFNRSLYTLFGQFPRLRTLQGLRFVESRCKPPSQNTNNVRALVRACPTVRRISWFRGSMLDTAYCAIIERNDSHVTWSVRELSLSGVESSAHAVRGQRGSGSFQL